MALPTQKTKTDAGYFHSLSRAQTEGTQYDYESNYKSAHSIRGGDIWLDSISYCATYEQAHIFAAQHPLIVSEYIALSMTMVAGSNHQAWYLNVAGNFIRPWISPVDVPQETTNNPSHGFQIKMYTQAGQSVSPTYGVWYVDYYAGLIHFQVGSTPMDLGIGTPRVTCFQYIGKTFSVEDLNNKENKSEKGVANGYAELDATGRLPERRLPLIIEGGSF